MKSQVEFIVIFALILIAVVVIITVSRIFVVEPPSPEVLGIGEEEKLIVNSIKELIKDSCEKTAKEVYAHGGLPSNKTIKYDLKEINIWYECGHLKIPDIKFQLEEGIGIEIKKVLKEEMDFFGKKTEIMIDKLKVEIVFQKDKMNINVNLPMKIMGHRIDYPYRIAIPSRINDIVNFYSEFLEKEKNTKFLENATLTAVKLSNMETVNWLPVSGMSVGCSNAYYLNRIEVVKNLEDILKYVSSYMVIKEDIKIPDNPFFVLGVNDYNLSLNFVYPEWNLNQNMEFEPNPIILVPRRLNPLSYDCVIPYDVSYSFKYPLIVLMEDNLMGRTFKFALMQEIVNNTYSDKCHEDFEESTDEEYQRFCVEESYCPVSIKVSDKNDQPLENAIVMFDKCVLGKTNKTGLVNTFAPCMIGEFFIYKKGYGVYGEFARSEDLEKRTIELLPNSKNINFHIYGVPITEENSQYEVSGFVEPINQMEKEYAVLIYLYPFWSMLLEINGVMLLNIEDDEIKNQVSVSGLPSVNYNALFLVKNRNTGKIVGYTEDSLLITPEDRDFYLYLPVVTKTQHDGISEDFVGEIESKDANGLVSALWDCEINTVSRKTQTLRCENA